MLQSLSYLYLLIAYCKFILFSKFNKSFLSSLPFSLEANTEIREIKKKCLNEKINIY
jgi:hypothetical protein